MANYTSTHTGATIDASVTIISGSGVTQSDLIKLNAVTSSAIELNILDGVTASTAEINILDGLTATTAELNYLDGADSSITTLSLPDNTTITTFGASLVDDADAASARTTLGVDVAGTDNSTDVTLVTTSHDYLSISGQAITLGQIDISDDTNLVGGDGLALTGDTLSVNVDDSSIEINSDTLRVKALGVTNAMLANSSLSYGGVSVALGSSDATPAFDLSDATSLPIVAGTTGTLSVARGGTGATTASDARTNLNVDVAGTDNSTDVTLVTTSHDYLSLSGQEITLGEIDISDDTNLVGGTGITLTGDTLSTTDSEIVHDNLSGFVANEHIDHSGVSITAGAGLTGGGDITATRDIAVGAGTGVTVNADDIAIGQDVATNADVTFNSVTADIIGDIRGATKFQAKADVALNKGDAVYISGVSGTTPTVDIADANDSAKMPSFGLAASSVSINASVEIITFGTLAGLNTSGFSVGDILFISTNGTSGNTLTATAPTGESSLIQNIGIVQRSHASAGSIKVGGAGRTNATPNLDDGDIFIGNGSNQAVSASLNTKIEDYLDGGTSTANFDTISVDGAEITATPAELNVLDGITSTTAELNYTDGVTSNIQTQLDAKAPLASPAFTGTATGVNLTLSGDLTVNGSTTTLDTTNLAVEDNLMELNAGVTSNANDSGFLIERGTTGDNAIFMWDESADKFTLGTTTATGTTTGDITLSSTGTLVANVEGNVTGAVTGNADTATTLATARNFSLTGDVTAGAVSFDGSGNVALSTTIAANSVALGTDTTGNYMSDLTEGTGIDISHTPGEGSNGTITLDLTEVGFGGGANRLITDDGDGTVSTEANLTFDGSTLALTGDLNVGSGDFFVDDSAGQVGIGTASPSGKLGVESAVGQVGFNAGTSSSPERGNLYFTTDGSGWKFNIGKYQSSSFSSLMTFQDNGNVGIGTESPSKKFVVKGASGDQARFEHNGALGAVDIYSGTDGGLINIRNASGTSVINLDARNGTNSYYNHTGNFGIGTSSPSGKLDVEDTTGSLSSTKDITAEFMRADGTYYPRLQIRHSTSGTNIFHTYSSGANLLTFGNGGTPEAMAIDDSGNVGIGTESPGYKLDVSGDVNISQNSYYRISNRAALGGDSSYLEIWRPNGAAVGLYLGGADERNYYDNNNHRFRTSGGAANLGEWNSTGLGIGVTSPASKLHIQEATAGTPASTFQSALKGGLILEDDNTTTANNILIKSHSLGNDEAIGGIKFVSSPDGSNYSWAGIQGLVSTFSAAGQLAFYTAANNTAGATSIERMRIDESGNVGIGAAEPASKLDLGGSTSGQRITFSNTGVNTTNGARTQAEIGYKTGSYSGAAVIKILTETEFDDSMAVAFHTGSSAAETMRIDSNQRVGIGTTTPGYKLDVAGEGRFSGHLRLTDGQAYMAGTSEDVQLFHSNIYGGFLFNQTNDFYFDQVAADKDWIFRVDDSDGGGDYREVMRIQGSTQNVGIGTASPTNGKLVVSSTDSNKISIDGGSSQNGMRWEAVGGANTFYLFNGTFGTAGFGLYNVNTTNTPLWIQNGGNVGIGTTSPQTKLHISSGATDEVLRLEGTGSPYLSVYDSGTRQFFLQSSGNTVNFYAENDNTIAFFTSGNRALDIDADRNLKFADNGTNPTAVINTAFLFNDGGELKVLDELGNTTTISPHNFSLIPDGASEERAWGYYSEKDIVDDEGNVTATQKVNVDMMKLARLVEQLTGEKLVYTEED